MRTEKLFGILTLFLCVFCIGSCSDDNEDLNPFPEGTSSLRMMNENNGKVTLGNSDVYITNEGNFQYGNATLSFYDTQTRKIDNEVFFRANDRSWATWHSR